MKGTWVKVYLYQDNKIIHGVRQCFDNVSDKFNREVFDGYFKNAVANAGDHIVNWVEHKDYK